MPEPRQAHDTWQVIHRRVAVELQGDLLLASREFGQLAVVREVVAVPLARAAFDDDVGLAALEVAPVV